MMGGVGEPRRRAGFLRGEDRKFNFRHVKFKNFGGIQEAVLSR